MRCNCDGRELLSRLGAGARKRHGLARPLDQPICQCHQQQATHNTKHGGELNLASCQMEDEFRGSDAVFFFTGADEIVLQGRRWCNQQENVLIHGAWMHARPAVSAELLMES